MLPLQRARYHGLILIIPENRYYPASILSMRERTALLIRRALRDMSKRQLPLGGDMDIEQPASLWRDTSSASADNPPCQKEVAHGPLFVMAAGYLALQPPFRTEFHVRTRHGEVDPAGIEEVVDEWRRRLLH